ncbi:MAG: hypothetical protein AABW47_03540 [Nanoarchaeota archaeon]
MIKNILHELKEHVPFTALATFVSIALAFLVIKTNIISSIVSIFYIFHPIHLFFSAIVSSALFYKYKKNIIFSILIGVFISIIIGSISDIFLPYLGSSLFGIPISFHLPAIENPLLIFGTSIFGAVIGITTKKTKFPHFLHVFISVFASLLYIFAYSTNFSLLNLFFILIITTISVVIPCCLGDIILPVLLKEKLRKIK